MVPTIPDLGLIAGESVTVRTPAVGYDEHMEEVSSWSGRVVEGVVVHPGATSDVFDGTRPDGARVAFTLGFPKTFTASLRGCRVIVRGVECAVIGDPHPLTAESVPGPWNYTAEVATVHG